MKCLNASVIAIGAVLTCAAHPARPAEIAIRVPDTAAARSAAGLISRAERAIRRYLDACESPDAHEPRDIVTQDARIEYTLDNPEAYLSLEGISLFAGCATPAASTLQPKTLWIYPTAVSNAVFVQYDMPAAGDGTMSQQIALVEMRGERIHRMRNFGAPPAPLMAAIRGRSQADLCARLSLYDGSAASITTAPPAQPLGVEVTAAGSAP
jgi:hypothetical protein